MYLMSITDIISWLFWIMPFPFFHKIIPRSDFFMDSVWDIKFHWPTIVPHRIHIPSTLVSWFHCFNPLIKLIFLFFTKVTKIVREKFRCDSEKWSLILILHPRVWYLSNQVARQKRLNGFGWSLTHIWFITWFNTYDTLYPGKWTGLTIKKWT